MVELGSLLIFVISEFLYNSVISPFFGTFLGLIQLGRGQSNCVKSGLRHIFFDPMASDDSQVISIQLNGTNYAYWPILWQISLKEGNYGNVFLLKDRNQ